MNFMSSSSCYYGILTIIFLISGFNISYASPVDFELERPDKTYFEDKGEIRGQVLDGDGEAVIGAQVVVNGTMVSTVTDIRGEFELTNLKSGTYILSISAIGFKAVSREITVLDTSSSPVVIQFDDTGAEFPEILVLGKSDRIFTRVPGSAAFINSKELTSINPISGNEVFRRVPGLHVVDEEGVGMRANIGIRGLDPDRSRSVLILEDGIPASIGALWRA